MTFGNYASIFAFMMGFIVIIFIYSVVKSKKQKDITAKINSLQDHKDSLNNLRERSNKRNNITGYDNVTRYGSQLDYKTKE